MTSLHETTEGFVNITGIPFEVDDGKSRVEPA
ncbi:MAG: hypothetical protein CM1200mP20_10830 [Pseudomonadota bacterium]|nr:MAG: hypothetical protein CM1200mP20_10830 [Pseudomonadota bacterium]